MHISLVLSLKGGAEKILYLITREIEIRLKFLAKGKELFHG
jgi:hypothetical protein